MISNFDLNLQNVSSLEQMDMHKVKGVKRESRICAWNNGFVHKMVLLLMLLLVLLPHNVNKKLSAPPDTQSPSRKCRVSNFFLKTQENFQQGQLIIGEVLPLSFLQRYRINFNAPPSPHLIQENM